MTAPAKPTIDEFPLTDEFIADIESGNVCDAECEAAAKYLRHYKRITESAGRPEPVVFLGQCQAEYERLTTYISDLLAYADRMAAERDAVQIDNESLTRQIDHVIDAANRCETAERQLAVTQAAIAATSKVIAEGAAKESQLERQLAELQRKYDGLVKDAARFVWYFRDDRNGDIESSKEIIELHLKQLSGKGVTLQQWRAAIDSAMSAVALREGEE